MRLGLGVVAVSLVWGVSADGDPQRGPANNRRPPPAQPRPAPAPYNRPQPAPQPYDPYNRGPQQAPQPYDPNAYDPYTDPRQPPPTPPPGYDPYSRPQQPPPQPYYPGPQQPPPRPYYPSPQGPPPQPQWNPPSPQGPPSQPQWNAPTPSSPPPPVTWNPSPSPSPVPSPTPSPSPSPSAPATGTREWNIQLVTPPSTARLPTPYNPPAPQECLSSGYGGSTYGSAPAITVQWPPMPEAYVPLVDITNGCGPGGPSVDPAAYYDLDVSTYLDSNTPEIIYGNDTRYVVNFRKACLMHDVGYSGAKSYDLYSNTVRDFFDDTRKTVDDRFYTDMVKECEGQIEPKATAARDNCREYGGYHMTHGAKSRYLGVTKGGEKVGAWKDRPNINGTWRIEGFPQAGTWTITQNKRDVVAKWDGGTAAPDYRGEFRGTLISHDAWATIDGFYVVYDKGVPRCQPVPSSWRWEPGNRNRLTVKGPGSLTLLK